MAADGFVNSNRNIRFQTRYFKYILVFQMKQLQLDTIGQRIEAIRREQGLTQAEFARALGISQSAVSKYLNNRLPPADVLLRIARLGHTTMEWILTGEKEYLFATAVREEAAAYDADLSLARQISRLPQDARQALIILIHRLSNGPFG
jgi:transcriptional regulator with XRE-family HTH domain